MAKFGGMPVWCLEHGALDEAKAFEFTKVGCFGGQSARQMCKCLQKAGIGLVDRSAGAMAHAMSVDMMKYQKSQKNRIQKCL